MYFSFPDIIITFLFIECFVTVSTFDWKNVSKLLKNKIQDLYKKKLSKSNVSVSVGPSQHSALDFPRNIETLNAVNEIWNDYYKCLKSKYEVISEEKTAPPYAIAAFTETFIELDCNVCVSPEDIVEESEWHFSAKPYISPPIPVEEDEFKQISAYTYTLHLSNLKKFHAGMYYCNLKNDVDTPYFLHVLDGESEPIAEVKFGKLQKPMKIIETNVLLWNDWTSWTECSICGKVGKRTKIGYCKVSLVQNVPDEVKYTFEYSKHVLNVSSNFLKETEGLLKYFVHGIPCRSSFLPKEFKENDLIKNFPTKILTGYCKKPCPSDVIVEIVDKNGEVLDRVNNSGGEYSVYQELPPVPATAERVTIYGDLGKPFVLPCPNFLYKDTPVEWSVGGKIWIKQNVEEASNGRISLNDLNEIVFYKMEIVDLKIYSCWQLKELAGVVHLKANVKLPYLDAYLADLELYPKIMFACICLTLAYISLRMCLNYGKATAAERISEKKPLSAIEYLVEMYHDRHIGEITEKANPKTK